MNDFKNIELNYEVNYYDVKELFLYPYKKYLWIFYLVVFFIILTLLIKFTSIDLSILIPGYFIYVIIIFIIKLKRINKKIKKFEITSALCRGKNKALLSDEDIKVKTQNSEGIYPWSRIESYFQTKNLHALILEGGDTTLFPKRYFDDELNQNIEYTIKQKITSSKKEIDKNYNSLVLEVDNKNSENIKNTRDNEVKTFSFILTLNDIRRLIYYYNRKINLIYFLAFLLISLSQINHIKSHLFIYILTSFSLVLFRIFILEVRVRNRFKSNSLTKGKVQIYLNDEGLKLESENYNANIKWSIFYKHTNLKEFHILHTDNFHSITIPKYNFSDSVNLYLEKKFKEKVKRK